MKCPFCNHVETQVKDSRPIEDNAAIRRRRWCPECAGRFTTYERVELRDMIVLKASGKREDFQREKIRRSLTLALRKRPFDAERIEKLTNSIVRQLESLGEPEISSQKIGKAIMDTLATLDAVAYVRFASVYQDFRSPEDFEAFLGSIPAAPPEDPDER
jgi:transcriptional repressor NrdR